LTRRAGRGQTYVVRANGTDVASQGNAWFRHRSGTEGIKPGDTIRVLLDVEHLPPLPLWTAVTTILYNVAIAVAPVHSL